MKRILTVCALLAVVGCGGEKKAESAGEAPSAEAPAGDTTAAEAGEAGGLKTDKGIDLSTQTG
ncbi:MAG: hypothetical protein OXT09_23605, partial [Myxococcales bacterium]|nr:hypothetical protein [Myxococcales bacterium]